ncbi:uncharacterized protein BDR25DRAFT_302980 [Lindgomyces ingoldianus]|uniref:Uncharacterized protein n=1 Tax=Lindgomyces ingoldianus TaxID=673940 RepID=A0ACB6QZB4_9PLEO|nr:uncharacterized protein BDR25DRAFT_302980 [Lindgomyces ingoldianus]KAF2472241.1 hypothetical protein BDR25DRAFT_302980 [Lindgomyces ingoldianus]
MGNLCGKQSKEDNFAGPGRTLGSAPPPKAKASIPSRVAKTDGATSSAGNSTGPGRIVGREQTGDGARSAAAAAAEARASKTTGGDLAKKLEAQKKQTQSQTLQEAARENRLQREADAATETRNYN